MKSKILILVIMLFAILQTTLYARSCSPWNNRYTDNGPVGNGCANTTLHSDVICGGYVRGSGQGCSACGEGSTSSYCQTCGTTRTCWTGCVRCSDACLLDSVRGCTPPSVWNSSTCSCEEPPCRQFRRCETYFNNGNGMGISLGPGIGVDTNYNGPGYYAMRLYHCDTCQHQMNCQLLMDVPGTCAQHGYCEAGDVSCDSILPGSSSSSAGSSSSYEPPDCVCLGCFGGSCLVTCSDGSNRTCIGDYDNCTELKNSPEWTQCTAPGPNSGGSSSSPGGGSSAGPSSQDNTLDGLNALIDTVHHSNELQEVGHGIMREGVAQSKTFFDDVRAFFGGLLSQVTGIFSNTNNISNKTNNINDKINNISNNTNNIKTALDSIKNRPRDTTIVNVAGDTNIVYGDTIIVNDTLNFPIDSNPGEPWDTAGAVASARGSWDSLTRALDSLPNPDTIHTGSPDSLVRGLYGVLDSGAGRIYRDTIDGLVAQGIANNTLAGQGSNTCPAFIMQSYPITIGSITFDLTQNVKLGQYLCNPVIGGKSAWDIGRTILRIVVAIGCMFFLFKCATGTLGGDD